jgi:hypothetical protein
MKHSNALGESTSELINDKVSSTYSDLGNAVA